MKTANDYITLLRRYLITKADAYGITKTLIPQHYNLTLFISS